MKRIEKLERVNIDLSSHQRDWEKLKQENASIALNVLFVSYNSEEIKLAYISNYNECKNHVILLIINDKANNYYYFVVKNLSELNSLGWLIGKKEAIINNDNSFQNDLDDALNYQTIKINPERISKLKPYINITALNILFIPHNTKIISVAYRSEYNHKRKKQVILLMITNGKKYHYLTVTNLSELLAKKSSNHDGDFYCLNCFNSYTSKNILKEHEEICNNYNNHNSCHIE